jgi:23S rRNA pseudouridine1911/1915/1917 synthase
VPRVRQGTIESELVEDKFRRVYSVEKRTRDSKHAVTRYRVVRGQGAYGLIEVSLETGRKNQIRVHLSDLGHPIVGDIKYGATEDPINRVALHAFYLAFIHPVTGRRLTFSSELPKAFEKLLR